MDIAVIGAGIAGLSAGWSLRRAGHRVRVFERNYKPGGRMNSRRKAGLVVDHGDRFILRDSPTLRELLIDCGLSNDVCTIDLPIYTLRDDKSFVEDEKEAVDRNRVTFPDGMLVLPEALRRHLGGYYSMGVTAVEWKPEVSKIVVQTEPPLRSLESQVDGVIIATPAAEAMLISKPVHHLLNPAFTEQVQRVRYTQCFTTIVAMEKIDLPRRFYGLTPPPASGLSWIAFEDLKCSRRGVEGWTVMIVHSHPDAAEGFLKLDEEKALARMYERAREYVPQLPSEWRWARGKRWEVAHLVEGAPIASTRDFPASPENVLIEFCGDYREGDGCEAAAYSGRLAAESLIEKMKVIAGK